MFRDRKIIWVVIIFFTLLLGSVFYFYYNQHRPHRFQVTFFDIGQGDASLIQFNSGQKMLVDCGADKKILAKLGRALPFYDRTIDYLLATHPDLDHYGGCVDVLKNYQVKEIIINGRKKENDPYWRTWDKAVKDEPGAIVKIMDQPQVWIIASSTLEFLSPDSSLVLDVAADDSNNYSIVFRLKNDRISFLFSGDMEEPLEKALVHKYCSPSSTTCPALQADVLKVGHHGSDSSSGEELLNLVRPQTAIISSGKDNHYGHPSLRVLKKLQRVGAEILRTDQKGDIMIPVDNK
ncbi:MAG: Late competence protein [Parcubacteria group bacterium Gr01-1014_13]|nr:MAG: Late competence protein [Parcubacteria group bacterium Gr01-1014_13]